MLNDTTQCDTKFKLQTCINTKVYFATRKALETVDRKEDMLRMTWYLHYDNVGMSVQIIKLPVRKQLTSC
jgi:hypothetical protein